MSDTVKLIIEIPKPMYECIQNKTYCGSLYEYLENGIPLDDIKAEIRTERHSLADVKEWGRYYGLGIALEILDNIGKAESEKGKSCSTCKNNDDEFSGECYECLKGIFDHYEAESEDKK